MICILKEKYDTGNNVSCMGNWEKLGKHGRAVNVSGKTLPRLFKLTALSSVLGSKVTLPEHFSCKGGLSLTLLIGNLLACKQGFNLQILFCVHPLTRKAK